VTRPALSGRSCGYGARRVIKRVHRLQAGGCRTGAKTTNKLQG
jgi:hypothetical protein